MIIKNERLALVDGIMTLRLKFSTRIVLVKLIDLAGESDNLIVPRLELAALCNVSRVTICRTLKQLRELEYITSEMRYGNGERMNSRAPSKHTISFHRITLAIKKRKLEIKKEVNELAA